jgi:hypothetical protein
MIVTTYATKLTDENLNQIVEFAKCFDLNLDYLQDTLEFNAEDGFGTYVIVSVRLDEGYEPIVTFTEMTDAGFAEAWKLTEITYMELFKRVIPV